MITQTITVLIIEDDEWLSDHFERVLKKEGYRVMVAPHALRAIEMIDDEQVDLIVLDVLLTGATAFALLHELQSYSDTAKIPVILCTNLACDLDMCDLKTYGVKKILDKTKMETDDLIATIKGLL